MRFDGIYSVDVLEHFVDPIRELARMKELLLGLPVLWHTVLLAMNTSMR